MAILWVGSGVLDFIPPIPAGWGGTDVGQNFSLPARWCGDAIDFGRYQNGMLVSLPFAPGVTSLWMRANHLTNATNRANTPVFGVGKSGVANAGIFCGCGPAPNYFPAILKYDGVTATVIALATSAMVGTEGRWDMRISNHGPAATVALYWNGAEMIPPTVVDTSMPGLDVFSDFRVGKSSSDNAGSMQGGGFIVASEDTRLLAGLVDLMPNAAGDANGWDGGAYTDIDETGNPNDLDSIYSNVVGRDVQVNLGGLPAGPYPIRCVKGAIRVTRTNDSVPANVGVGVKTNGAIYEGTPQAVAAAVWAHKQGDILAVNPATGLPWTAAEVTALQLNLHTS